MLSAAQVAEIVRLYGLRQWVEQGYKQVKQELGWADFQDRFDRAIRRHWALVCCAFTFSWWDEGHATPDRAGEPMPRLLILPFHSPRSRKRGKMRRTQESRELRAPPPPGCRLGHERYGRCRAGLILGTSCSAAGRPVARPTTARAPGAVASGHKRTALVSLPTSLT